MLNEKDVHLIGVPMDLGGNRRGVDMGPSAIRIAGLRSALEGMGLQVIDDGNVPVPQPESRVPRDPSARFLSEIAHCCQRLRARVERVLAEEGFPLVVGGDHSIACGTIAGLSSHYHQRGERMGLIWFDAHGDMNTPETSPSGNVHGMPLAACLGRGAADLVELGARTPMVDVERAVLIGIHDVDDRERVMIQESGIRAYTMRDVDARGISSIMAEAIEIVCDGTAGFHLSFDVDGCDPQHAPGVGTPVPGGMSYREAHYVMEGAAESGKLLGLELTEINPILDDRNRTAQFAVELVQSALGKHIL